jgi:uncharacterized protein YutE (UPF0331/DUF86 family)
VVDEGRVGRLLRNIGDRAARLHGAAAIPESERGELWLDGIKYLFVTAIEGCVDVAQHIASSERFPPPDTNAAAIRMLGDRQIVDPLLAEALGRAVGFRNVLVHQYAEIDDAIVIASLDDVEQLREFVAQVSAWLLSQTDG